MARVIQNIMVNGKEYESVFSETDWTVVEKSTGKIVYYMKEDQMKSDLATYIEELISK